MDSVSVRKPYQSGFLIDFVFVLKTCIKTVWVPLITSQQTTSSSFHQYLHNLMTFFIYRFWFDQISSLWCRRPSNRANSITQYHIAITIRLNGIKSNGKLMTVSKCLHAIFLIPVRQLICKIHCNNDDYTYQDTVAI